MEGSCLFSSANNNKNKEISPYYKKVAQGLVYPIYIITSSYNSPFLVPLEQALENQRITLAFQNTFEYFNKIPNTYHGKFFIILNDFDVAPLLTGPFLKFEYILLNYPKNELSEILLNYHKFIEQEENKNTKQDLENGIKRQSHISNIDQNKENISQSSNSKIQVRCIKKHHNVNDYAARKLFVYSNKHDDHHYSKYVEALSQFEIEEAIFIKTIEDYNRFVPLKTNTKYYVLMGEYSAINLRRFFRQADQILLLATNTEKCLSLIRGRITQLTSSYHYMDKLIGSSFVMKRKCFLSTIQPNSQQNSLGLDQSMENQISKPSQFLGNQTNEQMKYLNTPQKDDEFTQQQKRFESQFNEQSKAQCISIPQCSDYSCLKSGQSSDNFSRATSSRHSKNSRIIARIRQRRANAEQ